MTSLEAYGEMRRRNEEHRERVIRTALLLGFSAYRVNTVRDSMAPFKVWSEWRFEFDGVTRTGYANQYSAAYDWLRLQGLHELTGWGPPNAEDLNEKDP